MSIDRMRQTYRSTWCSFLIPMVAAIAEKKMEPMPDWICRALLTLFVVATPSTLMAQSRIMTCERDRDGIYCTQRPYAKRKVPQPTRQWNKGWEKWQR
jgi:hypothetical protein